jgi:hypothetical protein
VFKGGTALAEEVSDDDEDTDKANMFLGANWKPESLFQVNIGRTQCTNEHEVADLWATGGVAEEDGGGTQK